MAKKKRTIKIPEVDRKEGCIAAHQYLVKKVPFWSLDAYLLSGPVKSIVNNNIINAMIAKDKRLENWRKLHQDKKDTLAFLDRIDSISYFATKSWYLGEK
jgi:hypothetical protein